MSDEMGAAVVGCLVVRGAVRLVVRWCVHDDVVRAVGEASRVMGRTVCAERLLVSRG